MKENKNKRAGGLGASAHSLLASVGCSALWAAGFLGEAGMLLLLLLLLDVIQILAWRTKSNSKICAKNSGRIGTKMGKYCF